MKPGNSCLCCQSSHTTPELTLTSLFLSRMAWGGAPEKTFLVYCADCGFRSYTRLLTDQEASNYYREYRNESYVTERQKDEVFYSRKKFLEDETWMASPLRQTALQEAVDKTVNNPQNLRILDYGGGDGRLIANLESPYKFVYDISVTQPLPGIRKIAGPSELEQAERFDLIVCAQTLEHISAPDVFVNDLKRLLREGGYLYLELPVQTWRSLSCSGTGLHRSMIQLAEKSRLFHQILDFYSTCFRVMFGILPPFGMVPMREHVNFFTVPAVVQLGTRLGFSPEYARVHPFCGIQALLKK